MRKSKLLLLSLGILLIGGYIAVVMIAPKPKGTSIPSFGSPVEDFLLADIDGNPVSLSDFRGKSVVINFWLTTCEPCIREIPLLLAYYHNNYPDLIVIGINSSEAVDTIRAFVLENDIDYPILLDTGGQIARKFYVRGYPSTFFIDTEGVLRAQQIGELSEETLQSLLGKTGTTP